MELRSLNLVGSDGIAKPPPSVQFSQAYQYCMIFQLEKVGDKYQQTAECRHLIHSMVRKGLIIFPYLSFQGDELFVLIRAEKEKMKVFADKLNYEMPLNPDELQRIIEWKYNGNGTECPAGFKISGKRGPINRDFTAIAPFDYIYGKYEFEAKHADNLYKIKTVDSNDRPVLSDGFTKAQMLKLAYYFIKSPKLLGGCDIEIEKLIHSKSINAFFPLHSTEESAYLLEDNVAATFKLPWNFQFDNIKHYFGEKIALYFQFVGHYSLFLLIPALVGVPFNIAVWYYVDFSHPVLPFFAILLSLWSIIMLEYWKQKENRIALEWGMTNFEDKEPDRPEFIGEAINSFVDGSMMLYFPEEEKNNRLCGSATVIILFIALVIGVVLSIYELRFAMQKSASQSPYASTTASILNSIQILVFNMLYQLAVEKLTDEENHRTDTMYEDSVISKTFVFQFVNSYASFFFIAFVANQLPTPSNSAPGYVGECAYYNCMYPLQLNIAIIFGSRLIVQNSLDILIPYATWKLKMKKETDGIITDDVDPGTILTPAEIDFMKMPFNPMIDIINLYADTAIQFGFMTMFASALPIATLATLFNNLVKIKLQLSKLLRMHQRPVPVGAQDIGTWQTIFTIISIIAVATNAGIIVFTMDIASEFSDSGRLWIFIGFQYTMVMVQFICSIAIPDKSFDVEVQVKRMSYYVDKVINKVPDVDDELSDSVLIDEPSRLSKGVIDAPEVSSQGCGNCKKISVNSSLSRHKEDILELIDLPMYEYPRMIGTNDTKEVWKHCHEITKDNWKDECSTPDSKGSTGIITSSAAYQSKYSSAAANALPVPPVRSAVPALPAPMHDINRVGN